jgi:hypothetical protein
VLTADYLQNEVSPEGRSVSCIALRNFERFLCAVFGAEFKHVLQPLREALDEGQAWSRFDNVLIVRNVHVMLVRWMSDIHQRNKSVRFPDTCSPGSSFSNPAGCRDLLKCYILDLLAGARARREADDWGTGGHVDFYRKDHGRYWFIVHPKIGGVQLLSKTKKLPKKTILPGALGAGGGGGGGAEEDAKPTVTLLMRDGQRNVCAHHLCSLLRLKVKDRDGKERPCKCTHSPCKFWHPSQLSHMTKSQAVCALTASWVKNLPALAAAGAAAANATTIIWKAEPGAGAGAV